MVKGDKASGKAKEAVENVKEKANDVIDKFKKVIKVTN